jgi:SagB-type dehydrogenase family enzyme
MPIPVTLILAVVAPLAAICLAAAAAGTGSNLPPPVGKGRNSLEEVLAGRRSVRRFQPTPLTAEQIGQLCWAAQGITEPTRGRRTAPSAMASYLVEVYVATAEGVSHYVPATHSLQPQADASAWAVVQGSSSREPVDRAPAIFLFAVVQERLEKRIGPIAQRFAHVEVGHAAQNLLLQATALGLGAVPVAAFDESVLGPAIHLPPGHSLVYLIPVGHPAP